MCAWSPEEDRIILEMYESSGRKWGKIAAELSSRPNAGVRTSASVRNRYLRIEKGRAMRAEGKSKNRCAACGLKKLGHVCQARLNAARKAPGPDDTLESAEAIVLAADDAGLPIAPVALPIAPVADEAAEALAILSTPRAQVAEDDTAQAEEWPEPRKRLAWRRHEEQVAARLSVMADDETQTPPPAPSVPPARSEESDLGTAKLRLESGNVVVLTKQPSGELIMSMYMANKPGAAAAL